MPKPQARTTFELLTEMAEIDPVHEALVDPKTGLRLSYAELLVAAQGFSRALLTSGINHGDRVGILAGNRAEWIIAHFGITAIGAISVGLNTWASAHELAYQLEHSAIKLLFLEAEFRDRDFVSLVNEAVQIAGKLETLQQCIYFEPNPSSDTTSWSTFLARGNAISNEDLNLATSKVAPDNVACLLYTSGSTALPKGVPLLHQGLIENMWGIGERQHLVTEDRLWLAVSLFWSLASVNALYALFSHRATIVLQHHFDSSEALALIAKERCSVFYGTPNMVTALVEDESLSRHDLSSLQKGVTIGTSVQVQRLADLGVSKICNVYGLTETYGNSTVTDCSLPLAKRIETVGAVLPGQEIQIIDPVSATPVGVGEVGEITLRGNVTTGYWQDPERTAESFLDGGWFRTGDLGYLDEGGFLYFRGRLKEMVKTGGINVAPAEVEEILSTHPAVELAFVTGIPDERLDEALAAVIVLRAGHRPDERALAEHCRATLARYKTPRYFRFITPNELPLTTTGKLQRNRLGELFND